MSIPKGCQDTRRASWKRPGGLYRGIRRVPGEGLQVIFGSLDGNWVILVT